MNLIAIIILGIVVIGLVALIIIRNQKDKKEFVDKMNSDYPKKKEDNGDIETEDELK